jgi:hypothetical protein
MTEVELRETNIPAHIDIEEDIRRKGNGQVTFTVRLNNGCIVDYNKVEYVDTKTKYFGSRPYAEFRLSVKRTIEEQPPISRNTRKGDAGD